jgi:hypothetical protein
MSHHDHDHHDKDHHHHPDHSGEMPFSEKMARLLQHWMKHNSDHAVTYQEWADRARDNDLLNLADKITEIGQLTQQINGKLKEAQNLIPEQH